MNVLKLKLINTLTLTFLNYFKKVSIIILIINVNNDDWNAVLMQISKNLKWLKYIIKFKNDVWNSQKQMYDIKKKEC